MSDLTFTAVPYFWEARPESWVFVNLPPEVSEDVRDLLTGPPGGFGSVRVEVTLGATTWRTSLFPSAANGTYVLPLKRSVRTAEDVEVGEPVTVALRILPAGS